MNVGLQLSLEIHVSILLDKYLICKIPGSYVSSIVNFLNFICFEGQRDRQKESAHLLVHSPDACQGQGLEQVTHIQVH